MSKLFKLNFVFYIQSGDLGIGNCPSTKLRTGFGSIGVNCLPATCLPLGRVGGIGKYSQLGLNLQNLITPFQKIYISLFIKSNQC